MKKDKTENILISWHYTTHGISYLKHILSAFYKGIITTNKIDADNISQTEMNNIFDNQQKGFLFDKVYYLTAPQKTFDNLSTRRFNYNDEILHKDEEIKNSETLNIWKKIKEFSFDDIAKELQYVEANYTINEANLWKNQLWRDIQHYKISDQLLWFRKYSNVHPNYKNTNFFTEEKIEIDDLRNTLEIAKKLKPFINHLKNKHKNANFVINGTLGSNETQVVWQIFSELGILPSATKLFRSYDKKEANKGKRFKDFYVKEMPKKIVTVISDQIKLYNSPPKSEKKQLAELKMQQYLKSGFAILILGERGIGKTKLAEDNKNKKNFIDVNCASFANDTMAESELFGYKKGAFTGANNDRNGLFEEANNGILFLDEIHHLSHRVQAKLMKAIQTDENNFLTIRRLGDTQTRKLKTTLIFASNFKINKLREKLLPDFYDRISQMVIELPVLRDVIEEIPLEFEKVWHQMKFDIFYSFAEKIKTDNKLKAWLKTLELYGNYRDLQKIAIYYKTFLDFLPKIKAMIPEKNAFEFTKSQFDKYIKPNTNSENEYQLFSNEKNIKQMENDFKKELANWAIEKYKGAPNAAKHFKKLGGNTSKETLYKWKNS